MTEETPMTGVVPPAPQLAASGSDVPPRVGVLREAASLITGDRQQDYGPPTENFSRIAGFWNIQFKKLLREDAQFAPSDVAIAMTLLKMARAVESPKRDTFVDGAGYIAIAHELREIEDEK